MNAEDMSPSRWLQFKFWITVPTCFIQSLRLSWRYTDHAKGDMRRAWRITMGKDEIDA